MNELDVQTSVTYLYHDLVRHGYDPLAIAATFMVTALTIYAKQLPPDSYIQVVERIFSTADRFIDNSNKLLH